ncbi:MAG: MBL fold hydrolase [Syntrophus sp. (in: bacteria)]|nr:MBL fold hydrolase [Syntrophus sp. (in: bacteria)]
MIVHFWGSRGSLPSAMDTRMIRVKIFKAIKAARSHRLDTDEAIEAFIREQLPFAVGSTYGCSTPCIELKQQADYVLCDAGTGLRNFGSAFMKSRQTQPQAPPAVFHIFISHPHWDHIQGFPFFTPAYLPGNRINIYGCHKNLREAFAGQQSVPSFPVPLVAMRAEILFHTLEPGQSYEIAGYSVRAIKQNHPGDSYGYRFEKDGKTVVYSTDAEHKREAEADEYAFVDFFQKADLLIFDAQYTLLDALDAKENWGHSSNLFAVEMAVRADVRRLCLFHSEHTYDDERLDEFLKETRDYLDIYAEDHPLKIDLAADGLEIEL